MAGQSDRGRRMTVEARVMPAEGKGPDFGALSRWRGRGDGDEPENTTKDRAQSETAVSEGEGELLTVLTPRAVGFTPLCLRLNETSRRAGCLNRARPVLDERGWGETERAEWPNATAPILDYTFADTWRA